MSLACKRPLPPDDVGILLSPATMTSGLCDDYSNIFLRKNKKWAATTTESDPDFFARLSKQQSPEYLWIGCADSRVPANQIECR